MNRTVSIAPPLEQSRETKIGLLKARIKFFCEKTNMPDYVAKMERELAELEATT